MDISTHLTGHPAIVTGAARGIGLAIARALAAQGSDVALVDVDGSTEAETQLRAEFPQQRFLGYTVDVRNGDAVTACVDDVVERFGSLHVLVNNAGTAARAGLDTITADEWTRDVATNLGGTFHFCRAAIYPHMAAAGLGSIINISSISGINGGAVSAGQAGARSGPAYAASKGGIIALTKWIAKEVGHLGIRCNSVAPGPVESEMTRGQDYDLSGQALQQMGQPDDIAAAVAYLASPCSRFVTGQVIRVDGGAVMA